MKQIVILAITLIGVSHNACLGQTMKKIEVQRTAVRAKDAPKASGPYSQAIRVKNVQEMLFIAGQLPIIPETGILVTDPGEATKQCMKNLAAILKEANMDFSNVVETTILLKDIADVPAVNEAYGSFLQEPYPARMTFQAGALPKNAVVEIKMIAVR